MWLKREDIVTFNSSEFLYRSAHGAFIGRVFNKNGLEALGFFQRRLFLFELKCSMRRVVKAFTFTLLT